MNAHDAKELAAFQATLQRVAQVSPTAQDAPQCGGAGLAAGTTCPVFVRACCVSFSVC